MLHLFLKRVGLCLFYCEISEQDVLSFIKNILNFKINVFIFIFMRMIDKFVASGGRR